MSVRGERCAYLEGSAYLLAVRFFFGRGEEALEVDVATMLVVLARFVLEAGSDAEVVLRVPFEVTLEYWNLVNDPLKDGVVGCGVESEDCSSTSGGAWSSSRGRFERVCGIVRGQDSCPDRALELKTIQRVENPEYTFCLPRIVVQVNT